MPDRFTTEGLGPCTICEAALLSALVLVVPFTGPWPGCPTDSGRRRAGASPINKVARLTSGGGSPICTLTLIIPFTGPLPGYFTELH